VLSIALTALFAWFRITSPSDGARFTYSVFAWKSGGIVATPIGNLRNDLRENDIIIAIDNRPLESWVRDLFTPMTWAADRVMGKIIPYTVLREGETHRLAIQLGRFPISEILSTYWGPLLFAFVSQVVVTIVLLRRPEERAAQVLFIWAWSGSHSYAWSLGQQIIDLTNGFGFWLYYLFTPILWLLYWSSMLHFVLIFPQKLPLLTRFPKIIPAIYLGAYVSYFTYIFVTWPRASSWIEWIGGWSVFPNLVALLYLSFMVLLFLWGYKRWYGPANRKKVRWVVYGASISGGGGLILWLLPPILLGRHIISANTLGLLTLPFPITLAIAVLRHQLFDIDVLINRTLVYGLLTGSLAIIYFSSVVLLQTFFQALAGETSQVAIVASTLMIASLFSPLQRRVQTFIDRRFYRNKYDAQKTLASFNSILREEVDLESLQFRLAAVIKETIHPEYLSLWLREPD
jgi:hypothetical protein